MSAPRQGQVIADRYQILGPLGDGATGVVSRARDRDGAEVALKLMAPELAADEAALKRFGREASALSALAHPHVLRVIDCGLVEDRTVGRRAYLVTELLNGETLDQLLKRDALTPEVALHLAEALLSGLSYVHQHGVVHRDLKPENLFLARTPAGTQLKLLDFGLAKFGHGSAWGPTSILTQEGAVLGTPGYMAPEQAFGGAPVDARADVYAAGAILFELFAGRPVFVEDDPASLLRAHMLEAVPTLNEARADLHAQPELDEVLAVALSKTASDRFVDARVLDVALCHVPRPVAWLG